jgi:hypothetical protein
VESMNAILIQLMSTLSHLKRVKTQLWICGIEDVFHSVEEAIFESICALYQLLLSSIDLMHESIPLLLS